MEEEREKICFNCNSYFPDTLDEPTEYGICINEEVFEPFLDELFENRKSAACRKLVKPPVCIFQLFTSNLARAAGSYKYQRLLTGGFEVVIASFRQESQISRDKLVALRVSYKIMENPLSYNQSGSD